MTFSMDTELVDTVHAFQAEHCNRLVGTRTIFGKFIMDEWTVHRLLTVGWVSWRPLYGLAHKPAFLVG